MLLSALKSQHRISNMFKGIPHFRKACMQHSERNPIVCLSFLSIVLIFLIGDVCAFDVVTDNASTSQLSLDIYVDSTGKALVTGYAEETGSLSFLKNSQYQYENDTNQLYAISNSLTWKNGENWGISFKDNTSYDKYHITFYLPEDVTLGRVEGSRGLEYSISTSEDSLVVEFYGYGVENPAATVEYQQPLQEGAENEAIAPPRTSPPAFAFAAILILIVFFAAIAINSKRKKEGSSAQEQSKPVLEGATSEQVPEPETTEGPIEELVEEPIEEMIEKKIEKTGEETTKQMIEEITEPTTRKDADESFEIQEPIESTFAPLQKEREEIEITREMAAVMETLTERERSVVNILIDFQGRTTQAEIRYETGIPKSSLTGIIRSLERRKIVTKKERGRTNVIELSDWFKSGKRPD